MGQHDDSNQGSKPDQEPGEKAEPGAGEQKTGKASGELPMVEAPAIAAAQSEPHPDADAEPEEQIPSYDPPDLFDGSRAEYAGAAEAPEPEYDNRRAQPRSYRFALLAATIACAAGVGSFLGSMTAVGLAHHAPADPAVARTADARDVVHVLKVQLAEIAALKTSLEGATRNANGQFAKITDRLATLERAQPDAAKITHIAEAVDRLEKQHAPAAPEITGSIASNPSAKPPAAPDLNSPVLSGWIVQDVHNGRAMVESRYGGMFLVSAGSILPGLGRVEAVKRQDGQWVVVTARGVIVSAP